MVQEERVTDISFFGRVAGSLRRSWLARQALLHLGSTSHYVSEADSVSQYMRGQALARVGARTLAAKLLDSAYSSNPALYDALEAWAELMDRMGQADLATAAYSEARAARAAFRQGAPDRHFVFRHRGSFIGEIMGYDTVLLSMRKNALPYIARGNAYLAEGRPELALVDYNRALKWKRNSPDILALKGEALSLLGRYQDSLVAFDSALAKHPNDAEALNGRAIARMAIGAIDDANADWRRQLQIQKEPASARGCIALRMADYEAALPELESAIAKEPLDPYWKLYRLTALRRLGLPVGPAERLSTPSWPGPLLEFHAGRSTEREILELAEGDCQRAEALFQAGVAAFAADRVHAEGCWRQVVDLGVPSLIEYAAARNELSRLRP